MLAEYLLLGVIPDGGTPLPPDAETPPSRTLIIGVGYCPPSGDFRAAPDGIPVIDQAPLDEAKLDYCEDWSAWLFHGETIDSVDWEVDAGVTVFSTDFDATTTTIWLTGGTVNAQCRARATITTSAGRIDTRSFRVRIIER